MSARAQKNMEAVRRFLGAINRDDHVGICAELDEQVTWRVPEIHGVTPARDFIGPDAVLDVWAQVKTTTQNRTRVVLQAIEGDEDGVLAEGTLRTPGGMVPIGYVMEMRDGKIRSAETFVIPGLAKQAWTRRSTAD